VAGTFSKGPGRHFSPGRTLSEEAGTSVRRDFGLIWRKEGRFGEALQTPKSKNTRITNARELAEGLNYDTEMKRKNVIALIIMILIIGGGGYWAFKKTKEEITLLKNEGQKTRAIVIKTFHRKRGNDFKYSYFAEGKTYTASGNTYNDIFVDDSIEIIYYPKDPSISRPVFQMK
jgi:hypothetical protein